jgi:hypothetical protein
MDEEREVRRLREKHASLTHATEEWLSLLRDMERNGESGHAEYERYFQAYLQAKQQQKSIDLQLFNRRQGLST